MDTPSFIEDHISQIPALKLLMNMGWKYLSPEEALAARGGRSSNVLLEDILKSQVQKINKIDYKQKEFAFSESNINNAILAIRDLPVQDGFIAANKAYYELITLGKSFDQTVLGDKKSFSFRYIDWEKPENNIYHITEEYSVLRSDRADHYRPDIVLFINGIPMVIIECKSPKIKEPVEKAIEQHLRNQQEDGIRSLYLYSNLTFALASNEAKYGTTATSKEFWGVWKEMFRTKEEERFWENKISILKHKALPENERTVLFKERFRKVWQYFENLEQEEQVITTQDKLLFSFCHPKRLLEIIYDFILYDDGIKKVARYQQYFAIKNTLTKILKTDTKGNHEGGVIWHTQGSGKSLTMVMLAQLIASHPNIRNPKILLVTDRIDLDDQITETFKKCHVPVVNADKGASKEIAKKLRGEILDDNEQEKLKKDTSLLKLITESGDAVITTLIHKFEAAVNASPQSFDSSEIYILIDEGHRSQYGSFNVKMQKVFPNACFIAFTGTPLLKKEKSTASKFGGIIDVYSITDAVEDGAVVPLLYEGRHNLIEVNEKPLDNYFDKVSEPLTPYGKAALKRKYSSKNILNKADQVIYARAWDITEHYVDNFQGTGFKGQLVTPNKATAIKYKEYFDEIGKVSSEVIMSAPDTREGEEDAFDVSDDKVKKFWNARIDKYGTQDKYEKSVIGSFKKQDFPEIIIVVDKLLTGFDAPRNIALYLTRQLKEHTLLQAIARVNRVYPGKDYGYIIDYFGNLENLDNAIQTYSGDNMFDAEDLAGSWTNIGEEIKKLPQVHSEVWDIFKTIKNKYDEPAYEEFLSDEAIRHQFYEKVSAFARLLKLALSSIDFANNTPEKQIDKYKSDLKFFLALRVSVKRRFSDDIDYKEYEPQVQKLIDKHITTEGEVLRITDLVDIFDKEQREAEVEKLSSKSAKADHIASRTIRAINIKMNEDPIFYKKLSKLIREAIEEYHQQRIDEAEFLKKAKEYEEAFLKGERGNIPNALLGNDTGIAIYNLITDIFKDVLSDKIEVATELALGIDQVIRSVVYQNDQLMVDWQNKPDIEGKIRIAIDDYIFDLKSKYDIDLSFDDIDQTVEEALKVAKIKFV
ncbi:HsdR family type I site-specific deoxyribonuclease [Flavobacterium branchiarum]|uniref:Type I restriction enzyme endonuclease subunit n=1 Tax=Flavobacterium branchiarum TaxID=1114870 RepID=A0ABV5FP29_9FLAO|nr:HsdR family type I site-specific deoxyribonuclease [Flavobacterium branchiarum]MDN3671981.1 HsdR family type I site-specific deoxyribonuclease [Flavobacterium branchiarum]